MIESVLDMLTIGVVLVVVFGAMLLLGGLL